MWLAACGGNNAASPGVVLDAFDVTNDVTLWGSDAMPSLDAPDVADTALEGVLADPVETTLSPDALWEAEIHVEPDTAEDMGSIDILQDIASDDTAEALDGEVQVADDLVPSDPDSGPADMIETIEVAEPLPPADLSILTVAPYLMWVTSEQVSVRWETSRAVLGRVDYGDSNELGATVVEDSARTVHELRLAGLLAGSDHAYRVVYDGGAMPTRYFRTAPWPESHEPVRFVVWGDNQDGPDVLSDLMVWMAAFDPDFAIAVGDTVSRGTRDNYREQLFEPLQGFVDQVPFLTAAGNHERYDDPDAALLSEYFSMPGDEHCFGWRYDDLYFLFLDTDLGLDGPEDQRQCVIDALSSDEAIDALIQAAVFHKPPRIEYWFGGLVAFTDEMEAAWVREELEPLLEDLGVDIVFNGHNHLYAHSPETAGGITWVTTGGGGGKLDEPGWLNMWRVGDWSEIETSISEHHFLRVGLDDGTLTVEAVDRDGYVLHAFEIFR